ncbi:MAG: SCO family protein [Solirubrobacteraceae bacterium]
MAVEQQPPPEQQTASEHAATGRALNWVLAALVAVVIAGGVALLVSGKGGSPHKASGVSSTSAFAGSVASPPEREPPLQLRNYKGENVNIASYKGKAVLVTFVYTHCPDVCPLIVSNFRVAQALLGAQSSKAQIVAVSVDPRGDTPKTVAKFLATHRMTGRMQYTIGSAKELARVWKAWGVGSERDVHNPGLVEHTGLVYGISASGKVMTLYPGNYKPAELAHDVPLLAAR